MQSLRRLRKKEKNRDECIYIYYRNGGCHISDPCSAIGVIQKKDRESVFKFVFILCAICLPALTLPAIFYSTESVISAIAGFVVAVIFGIREKGLVVVAAAACVTVFVVERILAFL